MKVVYIRLDIMYASTITSNNTSAMITALRVAARTAGGEAHTSIRRHRTADDTRRMMRRGEWARISA